MVQAFPLRYLPTGQVLGAGAGPGDFGAGPGDFGPGEGLGVHSDPKSGHSFFENYRPIVPPITSKQQNAAIISTMVALIPAMYLFFFKDSEYH